MRSVLPRLLLPLIATVLPACSPADGDTRLLRDGTGEATQPACSTRNPMGMTPTFVNHTGSTISAWWIGFDCVETWYWTLAPGGSKEQDSYSTHVWRFREGDRDPAGEVVKEVVLDLDNGTLPVIGIP